MKRRRPLRSRNELGARSWAGSISVPILGTSFSSFIFVFIAFVLLAVSVFAPGSVSGLRMSVSDALAPTLGVITQPINRAADIVRNISGLGELQAENARLQQENIRLREWYQTALLLEAENKSLKDLLNVKVEPHHKTVTARILADTGNAFVKSVLVSAGAADGIKKGQAVLSGEGVIGRITDVGENSARVLLITDINSRVPVLVEDTRQHAILAGYNQNYTRLMHLPPDSDVKDGARIITSGHGGMFPPGLAIGRIEKGEKGEPIVRPFADFGRIVHVRIIDSSGDPNLNPGADIVN